MKPVKFTIITPTIGRYTLRRLNDSIEAQNYDYKEHILIFDGIDNYLNSRITPLELICDYRRLIITQATNSYGNPQRYLASGMASGNYILYIDDDDYFIQNNALSTLAEYVEENDYPDFVVFPCIRLDQKFFANPAGMGRTCTCQYIHRKIAKDGSQIRFMNTILNDKLEEDRVDYGNDGRWIEHMISKYKFNYFDCSPLTKVDYISQGKQI